MATHREGAVSPAADWQVVTPGYFEAMGIRVNGRTLDWAGMNAHEKQEMSRFIRDARDQFGTMDFVVHSLAFGALDGPFGTLFP